MRLRLTLVGYWVVLRIMLYNILFKKLGKIFCLAFYLIAILISFGIYFKINKSEKGIKMTNIEI